MKKALIIIVSVLLALSVAGCVSTQPQEQDNTVNNAENVISQNDDGKQNDAVKFDMPAPFGEKHGGGDENRAFYEPCEVKFDGVPVELIRLVEESDFENWRNKHNIFAKAPSKLTEYLNIYSFIVEFDIPDSEVLSAMSVYLQSDEPDIAISEEEMNIILSGNEAEITARFASQYSIVIGEHIYSPQWVYENSVDAYKDAGITPEMIEQKLPLYRNIRFTEQACEAFENKLGAYIGKTVRLMLDKKELYIGEYSLDWLTSHTIQDYEAAGITVYDLENLLIQMSGFEESSEYDWIKSCYDRMTEDGKDDSTPVDEISQTGETEIGANIISVSDDEIVVRDIYDSREYVVRIGFELDHTPEIGNFYWIKGTYDFTDNVLIVETPEGFHCPQRYAHTDVPEKFVGYIESADSEYIDVYAYQDKNGYIMSIPWAVVDNFPATDKKSGDWIETLDIYCGDIGDFRWAVVCSGPVMSAHNMNICTSKDGGKSWYLINDYFHEGIVEKVFFVSENEGYIVYSGGGNGKGFTKISDGGRSLRHITEYNMSLPLSKEDALMILKYELITAYENRYGKYFPLFDDPGSSAGDDKRLPFIIENLSVSKETEDYFTVNVIWDFLIEKKTGKIYKFYDGLDDMMIPFEPLDANALSFAG